jgi:hypothetical protein
MQRAREFTGTRSSECQALRGEDSPRSQHSDRNEFGASQGRQRAPGFPVGSISEVPNTTRRRTISSAA